MAVAGIIAEYNPFHRGHQWQIQRVRETLGPDTAVVVAMSGNFVQRGDFAILPKHARAEAAVRGGADLVLELPTPWSAAAAERFAQGGVAMLSATGVVTHLVFGSETGELAPLRSAAVCLSGEDYHRRVRELLSTGVTFASARQKAVEELTGTEAGALALPNNNLAVEYLRALDTQNSGLKPMTFPRVGEAHDSGSIGEISSASAIRDRILVGGEWRSLVPDTTAEVSDREMAAGRAPVAMEACQRSVLAQLRRMGEEDFAPYDGGGEGLYHRFYASVQEATSVEEILTIAKTKRYPLARLRRLLLHSYLGVMQAQAGQTPPYLRVLAANDRGRSLLRQMRKCAALPVITQPAESRKLGDEVNDLFAREAVCTDLYALAYPDLTQAKPGMEYRIGPVMI